MKWQVRNAKARILYSKEKEILVPPLSSVWLEKEELPDIHVFEEYVSYQAWEGETQISEGTVIFLIRNISGMRIRNFPVQWKITGSL